MQSRSLDAFCDYCKANHITAALLSNPCTITWLTGYAPHSGVGPSPFEGGPALLWWRADELVLIVSTAEVGAAGATGAQVCSYSGYTVQEPLLGIERQALLLGEVLRAAKVLDGVTAVEMDFLPASLWRCMQDALPHSTLQAIDRKLDCLRSIKGPDEILKIRQALRVCDQAQAFMGANVRPGLTEIQLWTAMRTFLEVAMGGRLDFSADLAGGLRSGRGGSNPGSYELQPGDPILFDVAAVIQGYWGDNAATYFAGEPGVEMALAYKAVRDALRRGIEAIRPGVRASEVDRLLRSAIRDAGYEPHRHHSGHGLGTSYHEEPRIVAYNDTALESGMVIALEPGVYLPEVGGVRLEHVVLVTTDGCELLTNHLSLDP